MKPVDEFSVETRELVQLVALKRRARRASCSAVEREQTFVRLGSYRSVFRCQTQSCSADSSHIVVGNTVRNS